MGELTMPRWPHDARMSRDQHGEHWTLTSTVLDGVTGNGSTLDAALYALAVREDLWVEQARRDGRSVPEAWV